MSKNTLAAAAALALLCACSHTRSITTQDGAVSIVKGKDGKDETVHVTTKDGSTVDYNTGKPITDYPADAPLYQAKSVMDVKSVQKHARQVTMQTSDSADKISNFYKTELESKGWKLDTSMNSSKMVMYVASKDNRKLVITISSDDGGKQSISQTLADN